MRVGEKRDWREVLLSYIGQRITLGKTQFIYLYPLSQYFSHFNLILKSVCTHKRWRNGTCMINGQPCSWHVSNKWISLYFCNKMCKKDNDVLSTGHEELMWEKKTNFIFMKLPLEVFLKTNTTFFKFHILLCQKSFMYLFLKKLSINFYMLTHF